eukprot:13929692-Ditylum_brightwellii.AAC.2
MAHAHHVKGTTLFFREQSSHHCIAKLADVAEQDILNLFEEAVNKPSLNLGVYIVIWVVGHESSAFVIAPTFITIPCWALLVVFTLWYESCYYFQVIDVVVFCNQHAKHCFKLQEYGGIPIAGMTGLQ